jgi:N-acetylmuramoyl-L-alanine amidase
MVILDPGHGINTPGKRSPIWSDGAQLFEWEFARDVCRRIERRLIFLRIPYVILVKEAIDVPLYTRFLRIKDITDQFPDAFGMSVHGNAAMIAGQGRGWEVWTSDEDKTKPKKIESDRLATLTYATARAMLTNFRMRSDYTDGDPDKEGHLYILRTSPCPFILTENGFYDFEEDCRFMLSNYGRELIAKMHVFAIETYLSVR